MDPVVFSQHSKKDLIKLYWQFIQLFQYQSSKQNYLTLGIVLTNLSLLQIYIECF